MGKSFIEIQKAKILASFNTDEGAAELRKAEIIDIEKGGKVAFIGEKRVFGGGHYIKTEDGWKYRGKGGTGQKKVASLNAKIGDTARMQDDVGLTLFSELKGKDLKIVNKKMVSSKTGDQLYYQVEYEGMKGSAITVPGRYLEKKAKDVKKEKSKKEGTGQKRVASATDHLMIEGDKHYIDILDPDTEEKKFKPGDRVKYEDDSGKKYEGVISNREHSDGDMFEVDFKEVGGSKKEEPKSEEPKKAKDVKKDYGLDKLDRYSDYELQWEIADEIAKDWFALVKEGKVNREFGTSEQQMSINLSKNPKTGKSILPTSAKKRMEEVIKKMGAVKGEQG